MLVILTIWFHCLYLFSITHEDIRTDILFAKHHSAWTITCIASDPNQHFLLLQYESCFHEFFLCELMCFGLKAA